MCASELTIFLHVAILCFKLFIILFLHHKICEVLCVDIDFISV